MNEYNYHHAWFCTWSNYGSHMSEFEVVFPLASRSWLGKMKLSDSFMNGQRTRKRFRPKNSWVCLSSMRPTEMTFQVFGNLQLAISNDCVRPKAGLQFSKLLGYPNNFFLITKGPPHLDISLSVLAGGWCWTDAFICSEAQRGSIYFSLTWHVYVWHVLLLAIS